MKKTYIILGLIVFMLGGLVWAVLYGPLFPFKLIDTEASRFTSPDNKVDAVYIQSDAGAMTSVRHSVYIVLKGQKPTKRDVAVFSGNRVWDVKVTWVSNRKLRIWHGVGRIYHFQNYIYPIPEDKNYMVEIILETSAKESN